MSEITTLDNVLITDLDILSRVCESLGHTLERDQLHFKAYKGAENPCVHRITHSAEHYQVGLLRARLQDNGPDKPPTIIEDDDGDGYVLSHDDFEKFCGIDDGIDAKSVLQHYAKETVLQEAQEQGLQIEERQLEDGSIQLVATGYGDAEGAATW